jgi:hypothetical protein
MELTDTKKVEKCGICERPFEFDVERDAIGFVQTDYVVPRWILPHASNVLSKTSQAWLTGISIICIDCADLMEDLKREGKAPPEIKYIHNLENGIYKALKADEFPKMPPEIQRKIQREVESNPLF